MITEEEQYITEADIAWLHQQLTDDDEQADNNRWFNADVANCCQGRSITCGAHYGHGA